MCKLKKRKLTETDKWKLVVNYMIKIKIKLISKMEEGRKHQESVDFHNSSNRANITMELYPEKWSEYVKEN